MGKKPDDKPLAGRGPRHWRTETVVAAPFSDTAFSPRPHCEHTGDRPADPGKAAAIRALVQRFVPAKGSCIFTGSELLPGLLHGSGAINPLAYFLEAGIRPDDIQCEVQHRPSEGLPAFLGKLPRTTTLSFLKERLNADVSARDAQENPGWLNDVSITVKLTEAQGRKVLKYADSVERGEGAGARR